MAGGAKQLIGLRVCRSSLLCKEVKRNHGKEGRHLGSFAGKRLWELLGGVQEQLDPGPRAAREETRVQKPSLKYGGSFASPTVPCPRTSTLTQCSNQPPRGPPSSPSSPSPTCHSQGLPSLPTTCSLDPSTFPGPIATFPAQPPSSPTWTLP